MSEACILHMMKQSGGTIDRESAEAAVAEMIAQKQSMIESGEVDVGLALQRIVGEQALDELHSAQAARIRTKKNLISLRQTDAAIQSQEAAEIAPHEAILNAIAGTTKGVEGGRQGIGQRREGYRVTFTNRWLGKMTEDRPDLVERFRNDAEFRDAVAHEILLEGKANKQEAGSGATATGKEQTDARYVADVVADTFETMRTQLNARGANIHKRPGYLPQKHNIGRMVRQGFEAWAAHINPLLKTPLSREVLDDVYLKITTGTEQIEDALEKTKIPGSPITRFGQQRVLEFKTPEAWLEYNRAFGDGHVMEAVVAYIEQASNVLAVQDVLGTSPKNGLERLKAAAARRIAASDRTPEARQQAIRDLNVGKINEAVNVALREHLGLPGTKWGQRMALTSQSLRTIQSVSKLGGAVFNALFGDLATTLVNARYHGMPLLEAATRNMRETLGGMDAQTRRAVSFYLGAGYDGLIGHIASRYDTNEGIRGLNAKINEAYFKLTGLTQVTDWQRAGAARMHSAWLGQHSGLEHNHLPRKMKHILKTHGIGKHEWNAARRAIADYEGETYLMPHKIQSLPDDVIDQMISTAARDKARKAAKKRGLDYDRWLSQEREKKRNDLETTLAAYMADETTFNVIVGDDYSARWTTGGKKEEGFTIARKLFMQFKTFPIAFTQRVLGRAWHGNETLRRDYGQLVFLFVTATLAGAAAYTLKELAKGNTPPDFSKPGNIGAAVAMGGGLGVFGDFFFSAENRYGRGVLESAAGPGIPTLWKGVVALKDLVIGDFESGGKSLARLGLDNVPFKNIWYMRAAFEGLVLDDMYTRLNPRYEANKARWRKRRGQESWLEEIQ